MFLQRLLLIGLAGLAGTLCRYGLVEFVSRRFGESFPTGTLIVNLVGCFIAGFLFYPLHERFAVGELTRLTLMIGFLGGFTTFSAFGVQTFTLFKDGAVLLALANVVLSNVVGLIGVWVGYALARLIWVI
jgi:fluoride exporter